MNNKYTYILFFIFFSICNFPAYTQKQLNDTAKVISIFQEIRKKNKLDKDLTPYDSAKLTEAYNLSHKLNFIQGEIQYFDIWGVYERNRANYSKSLDFHKRALELIEGNEFPKERSIIFNNIGVVYRRLDDLGQAARYHLAALEIAEGLNDVSGTCVSLNSLGNIYLAQKDYNNALRNFNAALQKEQESKNVLGQAINYNNIGSVYEMQGDYKKAATFYLKSLDANKQIDSKKGIVICYLSLGDLYLKTKKSQEAEKYLIAGYTLQLNSDDKIYTASCLTKLGNLYTFKKDYPLAVSYYTKGLEIARAINSKTYINKAYLGLSEVYELWGNIPMALQHFKLATAYQDSILDENKARDLNLKQVLYETGKKDKEIELLKYKSHVKDKKQKLVVGVLFGGIIVLLLLSSLIYFNYNLKRKAHDALIKYNRDIEEKNSLLVQQKEEIMAQHDQIEHINIQINEAYETIKIKTNNITDNIHYAVQIQDSLLPDKAFIKKLFPGSFVYYAPKDMVSGDFYWVAQKQGRKVVVVADCTGHGVTGAFMSIVGINALNEAVNEKGILNSNEILDHMRSNIVKTLQQGVSFTESKEGIHMVVCTFNEQMTELQFSGAINSMMIIRDGQILQYKGDKMPVSISPDMSGFTRKDISLTKGDMIYLYTDGYYGQFGGSDDRKFSTYRFKSLLQKICKNSDDEQLRILTETMNHWKGSNEQIDDMLVMGIRV